MNAIDKLIAIAKNEIGYLEKGSNAFLYDKTANAGDGNFTKYWADIMPEWNGSYWCAVLITWCFVTAFGRETTEKLLGHYPYVYVPTLAGLFEQHSKPQAGDIACFWSGKKKEFVHTGIVTYVDGDFFRTIEGNTSGASEIVANGGGVCEKSYYNSKLPGTKFIRPDYSIVEDNMTQEDIAKIKELAATVASLTKKVEELEKINKVYHYFDELPEWAKNTITDLYNRGIYKGNGPDDLNLPEILARCLVLQERINKEGR